MWTTVMFYQLFGLSFWCHRFVSEDPMTSNWLTLNFSKRRNKRLYILADLRVSTSFVNVHYLVNYSLKLHWIFALKYCMHKSSNALVVCAFWSLVFSTNQTDCSVFNLLYYLESFAAVLERKRRIQHVSRPSGHVNEKQQQFVTACKAEADGDVLHSDQVLMLTSIQTIYENKALTTMKTDIGQSFRVVRERERGGGIWRDGDRKEKMVLKKRTKVQFSLLTNHSL